jgi:hypothetical protein
LNAGSKTTADTTLTTLINNVLHGSTASSLDGVSFASYLAKLVAADPTQNNLATIASIQAIATNPSTKVSAGSYPLNPTMAPTAKPTNKKPSNKNPSKTTSGAVAGAGAFLLLSAGLFYRSKILSNKKSSAKEDKEQQEAAASAPAVGIASDQVMTVEDGDDHGLYVDQYHGLYDKQELQLAGKEADETSTEFGSTLSL